MQDVLKRPDIPACLRICAGTDGSVTQLLEVLTGKTGSDNFTVSFKDLPQGLYLLLVIDLHGNITGLARVIRK